ncbi:MAG TPA: hypothetical protein VFF11_01805, partial [Candidatus Binatia bacterium]|nr:hypothetical protein [Candidatus Binatia bacterium]
LKPRGGSMERTLTFYCEDGVDAKTGEPNYRPFNAAELTEITNLYPANSLTNEGQRHIVRGEFSCAMPGDVGGAGFYTNLPTSLGVAGFYVERFRGNDDLAGMTERRFKSADQLADLLVGWSRNELGKEPGYDRLHQFLDVDVRRDLKNVSAYWWEGQLVSAYQTNASEEFIVRFGQYLMEHGYFTAGEMPLLFREFSTGDSAALLPRIQRLIARKMGVPDADAVPLSLAFLGDEAAMKKSFDEYLAGTDLYRARLKQWEKQKDRPLDARPPKPSVVVNDALAGLVEFDLFGQPDHLTVRLSLPSAPIHSNGRWDDTLNQVVWETDIEGRTNMSRFPFSCFASWAEAGQAFQKKHFGKVAVTGNVLTQYCVWRASLEPQQGREWDAFVAGLQPGNELEPQLEAFRFTGETHPSSTNAPASPS